MIFAFRVEILTRTFRPGEWRRRSGRSRACGASRNPATQRCSSAVSSRDFAYCHPGGAGTRAVAAPSGGDRRPARSAAECGRAVAGSPPAGSTALAASPSLIAASASAHRGGRSRGPPLSQRPHRFGQLHIEARALRVHARPSANRWSPRSPPTTHTYEARSSRLFGMGAAPRLHPRAGTLLREEES